MLRGSRIRLTALAGIPLLCAVFWLMLHMHFVHFHLEPKANQGSISQIRGRNQDRGVPEFPQPVQVPDHGAPPPVPKQIPTQDKPETGKLEAPKKESQSKTAESVPSPAAGNQEEDWANHVDLHLQKHIDFMNARGRELRSDCDDSDFKDDQLVQSYLGKRQQFCRPIGEMSNQQSGKSAINGGSEVVCYPHTQTRHTAADSICEARNVAINLNSIVGQAMTGYVEATWMQIQHGALQGMCEPMDRMGDNSLFPLCLGDWFKAGAGFESHRGGQIECDEWIEEPVYFLTRNNNLNTYHCSEDWVIAYMVFAALKLNVKDVRIMFMDLMLPGPYNDLWNNVFSDEKLSVFHEWRDQKKSQGVGKVCLRHAIFNPPGSGSPISKDKGMDSRCRDNAIVQGFANLTLSKMGIVPPITDPDLIRITFISRKDYGFAQNQLKRKIDNEEEVVEALKTIPNVQVERVDFARINWREQLNTDVETDLLIGVHGAGMTQLMFLPEHAGAMELFTPEAEGNHHYHNLANWANKLYFRRSVNVHVDAGDMKNFVADAVQQIRARRKQMEPFIGWK